MTTVSNKQLRAHMMEAELSRRLALEYENYWQEELVQAPSGWVPALIGLWQQLDGINNVVAMTSDHRITWVSLRYEVYAADMSVFATPLAHIRSWTPTHAMALISALDEFHRRIRKTCEECGSSSGFRHKTTLGVGGGDRILCAQCARKLAGDTAK